MMDNIEKTILKDQKFFGIEWSKQINTSTNPNTEIQSALSEASSLLTQFDEVNSENKLDSNSDANS